jgi:hypothetical protein
MASMIARDNHQGQLFSGLRRLPGSGGVELLDGERFWDISSFGGPARQGCDHFFVNLPCWRYLVGDGCEIESAAKPGRANAVEPVRGRAPQGLPSAA